MEQVYPVEIKSSSASGNLRLGMGVKPQTTYREGVIEKILEPGSFIVTLADGAKVKVKGSPTLKAGARVQVQGSLDRAKGKADAPSQGSSQNLGDVGLKGSALMPLGFGGKGAKARLEIFTEKQSIGGRNKASQAVYFILLVQTQELGEVQWSIHMMGRNVALQVFALNQNSKPVEFKKMVSEVEQSLRAKGFVLTAPTVFLRRLFKTPAGFQLNVRG